MSDLPRLLKKATTLHQAGKFSDAEHFYIKVLKVNDRHLEALGLVGALYLQMGQFKKAEDVLQKAIGIDPKNPPLRNNLGAALQGLGRSFEAMMHYKEALSQKPDYPDALNNLGGLLMGMGQLDDAKQSFLDALSHRPDFVHAHCNMGHIHRLSGRMDEAERSYLEALRIMPAMMDAVYHLGALYRDAKRFPDAIALYEKTVAIIGQHPPLWNNLGNLYRETGRAEDAAEAYQRALRLKPDYREAMINLATASQDLGRYQEARTLYETVLRDDPRNADALSNLGIVLNAFGETEQALQKYEAALAVKPQSIDALWNKSLALLSLGRYEEGWPLYNAGLGVEGKRGRILFDPSRLWRGQDVEGKRLLLWCEQGLGDSLQFIRYASLCKAMGAKVLLLCPPELGRILSTHPAIDQVLVSAIEQDFEYHIPLLSLPQVLRTRLDTIPADVPYLFVDDRAEKKWAGMFSSETRPKIGLVWAGSARRQGHADIYYVDARRSLPLRQFAPMKAMNNLAFVSLQMGEAMEQIDALGWQDWLRNPMHEVADMMDTAAIVNQLDLVITVDTSVAHLAGALGKNVWILSRRGACWRWLGNRPNSPWYPTVRIFGQNKIGVWSDVVEDVVSALAKQYPQ